ncbi:MULTISPECIES: hypothetical protein [Calothrix]|nr:MULTISPECIES: hypothetical protein [Calothrix]
MLIHEDICEPAPTTVNSQQSTINRQQIIGRILKRSLLYQL